MGEERASERKVGGGGGGRKQKDGGVEKTQAKREGERGGEGEG